MTHFVNDFKDAIPVTWEQLESFYGEDRIFIYKRDKMDCYILSTKVGVRVTDEFYAGIRFSDEPSDYASLCPHVPLSIVKQWGVL